jgi:hypothetical protein
MVLEYWVNKPRKGHGSHLVQSHSNPVGIFTVERTLKLDLALDLTEGK